MSTIAAKITSDLRSRANYLPPCPLCSHTQVQDFPDSIRGPSHRTKTLKATHRRPERIIHRQTSCCALSTTEQDFESEADAARYWAWKRQQPLPDTASEMRRLRTLERLERGGWEALTHHEHFPSYITSRSEDASGNTQEDLRPAQAQISH